jgi:hypothetical protein
MLLSRPKNHQGEYIQCSHSIAAVISGKTKPLSRTARTTGSAKARILGWELIRIKWDLAERISSKFGQNHPSEGSNGDLAEQVRASSGKNHPSEGSNGDLAERISGKFGQNHPSEGSSRDLAERISGKFWQNHPLEG